jgi:hypothetical protein
MARARRAWSTIRDTDIRPLLRETTAASSYWADSELLLYANLSIDLRAGQMMEYHEGWFVDRFLTNLVANQKEYTLQEGADRIRRILMNFNDGGNSFEVPLQRLERHSEPVASAGNSSVGGTGVVPSYRLMGELIYLEPAPTENRTNGLIIECESLPARLTGDADKLDLKFPSLMESLLVYDVVESAMAVEDSQGNVNPEVRGRIAAMRTQYERMFEAACEQRSFGRSFSTPFYLGD